MLLLTIWGRIHLWDSILWLVLSKGSFEVFIRWQKVGRGRELLLIIVADAAEGWHKVSALLLAMCKRRCLFICLILLLLLFVILGIRRLILIQFFLNCRFLFLLLYDLIDLFKHLQFINVKVDMLSIVLELVLDFNQIILVNMKVFKELRFHVVFSLFHYVLVTEFICYFFNALHVSIGDLTIFGAVAFFNFLRPFDAVVFQVEI